MKNGKIRDFTLIFIAAVSLSYAAERLYTAYANGYLPNPKGLSSKSQILSPGNILTSEQKNDNHSLAMHIPEGTLTGESISVTIYFENPLYDSDGLNIYDSSGPSPNNNAFTYTKNNNSFFIRFNEIKTMDNIAFIMQISGNNTPETVVMNEHRSLGQIFAPDFAHKIPIQRFAILFIIIFILLIYVYGVRLPIFKYRYAIAIGIFIFLVANQYHMSSIGAFDSYIQHSQGSEYVQPIFGTPRHIRSDEWLVVQPQRLAAQYGDAYGIYNPVLRGILTNNASGTSFSYAGLATLAYPLALGSMLFGPAYGISVWWCGYLITTLMASFEMCRIITGDKRLLSFAGASLITFSAYFQWWSYVAWIASMQLLIVCFYYFLHTDKIFKRVLWALGIAISFSHFVVNIYPAWQVPSGYFFLLVFLWVCMREKQYIKQLSKADIFVFICALTLSAAIIASHLNAASDYLKGITNTVYPGSRADVGGGGADKLQYSYMSLILPFTNIANPCEPSAFLTFFPVPMLLSIWYMAKQKKANGFIVIVLAYSAVMLSYSVIGWPQALAKYTLLQYSSSARVNDIIGFSQLYLLIYMLSKKESLTDKKPLSVSITAVSMSFIIYGIVASHKSMGISLSAMLLYIIAFSLLAAAVIYSIITPNKTIKKTVYTVLLGISLISGLSVHPVSKGLDAIYSKPVAQKIRELATDTDEKWIAIHRDLFIAQQFMVACGASTINSTNVYPNMDAWSTLDPEGKYEDVYNRYAHVTAQFTEGETYFEQKASIDVIALYLSYKDISKLDISYIYTDSPLESSPEDVRFELLYAEDRSYIYKIYF